MTTQTTLSRPQRTKTGASGRGRVIIPWLDLDEDLRIHVSPKGHVKLGTNYDNTFVPSKITDGAGFRLFDCYKYSRESYRRQFAGGREIWIHETVYRKLLQLAQEDA